MTECERECEEMSERIMAYAGRLLRKAKTRIVVTVQAEPFDKIAAKYPGWESEPPNTR